MLLLALICFPFSAFPDHYRSLRFAFVMNYFGDSRILISHFENKVSALHCRKRCPVTPANLDVSMQICCCFLLFSNECLLLICQIALRVQDLLHLQTLSLSKLQTIFFDLLLSTRSLAVAWKLLKEIYYNFKAITSLPLRRKRLFKVCSISGRQSPLCGYPIHSIWSFCHRYAFLPAFVSLRRYPFVEEFFWKAEK